MISLITIKSLIQDDIQTHGMAWTAKRYAKKMCFTHFYFLAFGKLPRALEAKPVAIKIQAR